MGKHSASNPSTDIRAIVDDGHVRLECRTCDDDGETYIGMSSSYYLDEINRLAELHINNFHNKEN